MDITTLTAKMKGQLDAWLSAPPANVDVVSGQPFIVYCDGLALRLQGNAAIPTACTPGLPGISHMARKDAEKVAVLFGNGYRAVAAKDVASIRASELQRLISALSV